MCNISIALVYLFNLIQFTLKFKNKTDSQNCIYHHCMQKMQKMQKTQKPSDDLQLFSCGNPKSYHKQKQRIKSEQAIANLYLLTPGDFTQKCE